MANRFTFQTKMSAPPVDLATGKVLHMIPVSREPEGVSLRPDGKVFYVTCETEGEIYAIDTTSFEVAAHFNVGGRPRSTAFLPDDSEVSSRLNRPKYT